MYQKTSRYSILQTTRAILTLWFPYSRCPGLTGYIAKRRLRKVPILSIWMKRLYCLFLNRQDIKEGMKTILKGIDQIKHGISMCIFPEGTRNDNPKELLPFKEGSFKLALKTGCPIIPIAMTNTPKIYEAQAPLLKDTRCASLRQTNPSKRTGCRYEKAHRCLYKMRY